MDEGEEEMKQVYRFTFDRRAAGGDVVRLVFYDRHYKPVERYVEFRILPAGDWFPES